MFSPMLFRSVFSASRLPGAWKNTSAGCHIWIARDPVDNNSFIHPGENPNNDEARAIKIAQRGSRDWGPVSLVLSSWSTYCFLVSCCSPSAGGVCVLCMLRVCMKWRDTEEVASNQDGCDPLAMVDTITTRSNHLLRNLPLTMAVPGFPWALGSLVGG